VAAYEDAARAGEVWTVGLWVVERGGEGARDAEIGYLMLIVTQVSLESIRENFSRPSGTDSVFPAFSQL
jgi:hypothetical protein